MHALTLREDTTSAGAIVCCRTDTKSNGKLYDDRPQWDAALTTEASDLYNVYYPVMEAQVVTDGNGKPSQYT